jgi:hypothetical protein
MREATAIVNHRTRCLAAPCAGVAHTFFVGANDKPRAGELINVLREAGQEVPEELLKFGTTGACPRMPGRFPCACCAAVVGCTALLHPLIGVKV